MQNTENICSNRLPEIPLDMSCCSGSDNEDLEVKQEPMDSDKMKSESAVLKSEDASSVSQGELVAAQLKKVTQSGKVQGME